MSRALAEQATKAERHAATLRTAEAVTRKTREALDDADVHDTDLATKAGYSATRIGAWWRGDAHVPLWLPAIPAVPIGTAMRIVGEVLALRAEREPPQPVETATALVVSACGEALAEAGRALADGRVDGSERLALRRVISRLRDRCDRWLRDHGGDAGSRPERAS